MKKGYLILADGQVFEGELRGAAVPTLGELVFTTNMCGYMETLTDPSYYGQIILQTFPLIGNYGAIPPDAESAGVYARGYVVRELCAAPSNFRSAGALESWLISQGITVLAGIDTRLVTRTLRESGVMNAAISDTPDFPAALKSYKVTGAVAAASCKEKYFAGGEGRSVALIDYGAKGNIARCLIEAGCAVTVLPHKTAAEEILSGGFSGVMLSNGPGDPADNPNEIAEIKKLLGKIPIFGICLGHQMLALASGGSTVKLHYGHRGGNQPVKDMQKGRVYITSQNHGYAVDDPGAGEVRWINANDKTNEGSDYPALRAFSVQFHPEAASGPHDTRFLFKRFVSLMGGEENAEE